MSIALLRRRKMRVLGRVRADVHTVCRVLLETPQDARTLRNLWYLTGLPRWPLARALNWLVRVGWVDSFCGASGMRTYWLTSRGLAMARRTVFG